MGLEAIRVRPGSAARGWLFARIRSLQMVDALRAVTVVVSNHYLGLALRRELAQVGYANVRFVVLARVAESIGAPSLAARGLSPLSPILEDAAVRAALRRSEDLGSVAVHRSVVEALRALFRDLRELGTTPEQCAALSGESRMAVAAFRAFDDYRASVVERTLYDETDLLDAAASALASDAGRAADELGHVVVYLPSRWSVNSATLIGALGAVGSVDLMLSMLGDELADREAVRLASALGLAWLDISVAASASESARLSVLTAPLPAQEVREVVRAVLTDLEAGVPLHHMAVLIRREEPYLALVREALAAAGLPWALLGGRSVAESVVGRGLLGLLRLREQNFARTAVLDWRSTLGAPGRGEPSFGEWNRISREAEIVRGVGAWLAGLARFDRGIAERLAPSDRELSDGYRGLLERQRRSGASMAETLRSIDASTQPPTATTWDALVDWAQRCRHEHVPTPALEVEQDAAVLVDEVLESLRAASAFEPDTDLATFIDTLESALEARVRPDGHLGSGIVVGDVATAAGMSFERVYLVGLSEGVFPAAAPADPVFPDGDPLGRRDGRLSDERRGFLAALAAADGGAAVLSAPSWDAGLRSSYAAPWLLEIAASLEGRSVTAAELRRLEGRSWLRRVVSPSQSLDAPSALLDVAESRVADARRCPNPRHFAATSLARRADLPLARNLEVHHSRWSAELTAFDGYVASAASSHRLAQGLARGPVSPTAIELWARCPFRYFLGRVLYVEATQNPEDESDWSVSPLVRGGLVHEVLERFFRELQAVDRPTMDEQYTAADHARLEEIATAVFTELDTDGRVTHALAWANERDGILVDLHTLLAKDREQRVLSRVLPALFEQSFGFDGPESWPAAVVPLRRGGEARIHGFIDRVDLAPSAAEPRTAVVLDYKTGSMAKNVFAKDPVVAGTKVQLPAYARAAAQWLRDAKGVPDADIAAEYWMVSADGKFERISAPDPELAQQRFEQVVQVMDAGLRMGAFPQVPGAESQRPGRTGWDNCMWCDFDRICPTGRDQLAARKRADPPSALHASLTLVSEDD